ncbi:MAG: chemotaxis protein methyltransferase CheR [Phycisphaerales bacterium]|jgi:chemotaxis protein methyltransferase CheR
MSTLKTSEFKRIAEFAQEHWGLHITDVKRELVTARLTKFLRKSSYASMNAYLDHMESHASKDDLLALFDVLSTNMTSFFRERQHFDYLEREFYTPLARGNLTLPGKKIRIWSAACSTGPEAYSLAINAMEHLPNLQNWDFKILATDLSTSVLKQAEAGVYPASEVSEMPKAMVSKYFQRGTGASADQVRVAPSLRELVTVRQLNLMESWPFRGPFDIIFCRNVMIYFDKPTRTRLMRRMIDMLRPGGVLAVGSAETLGNLDLPLRVVQPSVYVK